MSLNFEQTEKKPRPNSERRDSLIPFSRNPEGAKGGAADSSGELRPNQGMPLHFDWVESVRVNTSAVERRAATLGTRRTVKKDWQIAWLLRAISCMDLTTLSGDDTDERVRVCVRRRVRPMQERVGGEVGDRTDWSESCRGVRVPPVCGDGGARRWKVRAFKVAAVSTGFPAGLSPLEERVEEIRRSVSAGADEIDVVITRGMCLARSGRSCMTKSPRSSRRAARRT